MLRSSEMADLLGITKKKMIELANAGHVPAVRLPSGHYRFDPEAVIAALQNDVSEARDDG